MTPNIQKVLLVLANFWDILLLGIMHELDSKVAISSVQEQTSIPHPQHYPALFSHSLIELNK